MAHNVVTIDVVARFVDKLSEKAAQAGKKVDDLDKKRPKPKVEVDTEEAKKKTKEIDEELTKVGKKQPKPKIGVQDDASKKILSILDKAQSLANRIFKVAVKIHDNDTLRELTKIEEKARTIAGKTWTAIVKIKDLATSPLKALYKSIFNIKTLIAGIVGGFAFKKAIMEPIKLADQYSGAKIGFSTLLGEARGQQMMDEIDAFAKATPFKTSGVISNVQKMMAYGWDVERVIDDMKVIGDAAAATGKGDQGLESIVYALSEIRSKGKLSTQELNQLASAGIKAKAYLAQGLGYGTSDEGMAALAKDLEKGAVGANQAIELILQGMKEFEGMMDKTANETVEGLWAQLEDTFEINIFRRWGQGLQDGAKRGFGSIVKLLDQADGALMSFGDTVYDVGKTISNYFADVLDNTVKRITDITGSAEFQAASLPEKISMLWKGAIANPFKDWWETTVKPWWENTASPWLAEKAAKLGTTIGKGLSKGLLALLGVDVVGAAEDGASIAGSFVQGFMDGFDGGAVTQALVDAIANVWSALPIWAKILLGGYGVAKGASMITSLAGGVASFAGGAAKFLGGAAAGTGLLGVGSNAAIALGAGNLAGGASLGVGTLSALGLGSIAGGAIGGATAISGGYDIYRGFKDNDAARRKGGIAKVGGVGAGALTGAMIGSVVPGIGTAVGALIGAGVGGIAGTYGANSIKKKAAEEAAALAELEAQMEDNDKAVDVYKEKMQALANTLGNMSLTYAEVQAVAANVVNGDMTEKMQAYAAATGEADKALMTMNSATEALNKMNWKASIGFKFNESDKAGYMQAVQAYIANAEEVVESQHYKFTAAVTMLIDPDNEAGQSMLGGGDAFYAGLQAQLDEAGQELTAQLNVALEDGVIYADEDKIISELQSKIAEIQEKVAKAQSEASMEALKIKFSAGTIDAESFDALQKEITAQIEKSTTQYDDALTASITSLKLQLDEGAIDQATYDEQVKTLTEGYTAHIDEINASAESVQLEILADAFDIDKEQLSNALHTSMAEGLPPMHWTPEQANRLLGTTNLTAEMATGIGTALQSVAETSNMDMAAVKVIGQDKIQEKIRQAGESAAKSAFSDPINVSPTINATATVNWSFLNPTPNIGGATKEARGGLISGGAQLAMLGEEGTPEMVIPLGSQRRSRGMSLWQQAGHMLGVPGFAAGGIVGGNADEGIRYQSSGGTASAGTTVNVGGVTVELNVDGGNGGDITAAIAEKGQEIAEYIAGILADAFQAQFENTPARGTA